MQEGTRLLCVLQLSHKSSLILLSLYKQTIRVADEEGDITTRRLFEEIVGAEEEHHDTFTKLLEK